MKNLAILVALVVVVGILAGCAGGMTFPYGNFLVTIGGTNWNPLRAWFYMSGGTLYVWAYTDQSGTSPYLELIVPNPVAGQTYDLKTSGGNNAWAVYGPDQNLQHGYWSYNGSPGSVTVGTLTGSHCSGSFDFQGRNPNTLTTTDLIDGIFSVGLGPNPN